jgi:hypothetical protein
MLADWYHRYEQRISIAAMIAGFIFDSFTIRRIDLLTENIVILVYLALAGGALVVISLLDEYMKGEGFLDELFSLIMQFAFGGLASAFFIFYSRSASIFSSWPFLLMLLFFLVGNEFFKSSYGKLSFRGAAYYFCILSYSVLIIPVVLANISDWVFVLSLIISLLIFKLLTIVIKYVARGEYESSRLGLLIGPIIICSLMLVLYFTRILPPIPLALKDAGVYQSLTHSAGNYILTTEKRSFMDKFDFYQEVHIVAGSQLYFFSSVFAPTKIKTEIVHEWQMRDQNGKWQTVSTVSFPVTGGADGGYRGYSQKSNFNTGRYRVNVKTPRGSLIGRTTFDVVVTDVAPELVTVTK